MPISKEFRFFIYRGKILSGGFYWSSQLDRLDHVPSADEVPAIFMEEALSRVSREADFLVMDIALTAENKWIVIELNCGTQSGISENNPKTLYSNLYQALDS